MVFSLVPSLRLTTGGLSHPSQWQWWQSREIELLEVLGLNGLRVWVSVFIWFGVEESRVRGFRRM